MTLPYKEMRHWETGEELTQTDIMRVVSLLFYSNEKTIEELAEFMNTDRETLIAEFEKTDPDFKDNFDEEQS